MTGGQGPARDLIGYGTTPPRGTWPGGAQIALNIVLNVEEGSERSYWAGDGHNEGLGEVPRTIAPGFRDLAVESTYEFGSRVGVHRMLRLFDRQEVPITVFAAAQALEVNTPAAQSLRDSAHEVCAHGYRWAESWTMTEEEERENIARAHDSISATIGRPPAGWYSRWMPSTRTRRLLVEHGGYSYDADAYNDEIPYYVEVGETEHLVVPYSMTYNDSLYSYGLVGGPGAFLDYCVRGLDYLAGEGDGVPRLMSLGLHPRLSGQAARASAVAEFVEHAKARGDVWIATREQIAEYWRENFPAQHRADAR